MYMFVFMSTFISHHEIHEMPKTESQKSERVFMSFVTCVDAHFGSLLREKLKKKYGLNRYSIVQTYLVYYLSEM